MTPDPSDNVFVKFIEEDRLSKNEPFFTSCMAIASQHSINREDAEDLYQEMSTKIIKNQPLYDRSKGTIEQYLDKAFINTCRGYLKRKKKDSTSATTNKELLPRLCIDRKNPLFYLSIRERVSKIYETLAKLSDIKIETIYLRASGMSIEQIATGTNAPIGTVKSRLHSARKTLKQILSKHDIQ
jgi:RNA polymerase sigma-70 factor (ECF subfamily)